PGAAPSTSAAPNRRANAAEPPIGAPAGRAAGAPLDLASMGSPNGAAPGQPPRSGPAGSGALATLAPSQTPRDEYDLAYGYVLRQDSAPTEGAFRGFLRKYT